MAHYGTQWPIFFVVTIILGCTCPKNDTSSNVYKPIPKSLAEIAGPDKTFEELLAIARGADRIECEVCTEIGRPVRVGPFVISDATTIQAIAEQLRKLQFLKPNVYKGWGDIHPHTVRVTFVQSDRFRCERMKLYAHGVIVFPTGEPFEGMIPDNMLADIFQREAEKHFHAHPEDVFKIN